MASGFNKVSVLLVGFMLFIGVSGSVFAGEYEGSWILNDSNGKPFEVTLSEDGTATGTHNDSMKQGTWKEEDGAAVIHWNTGWTTRIAKQDGKYVKTAFKPGSSLSDKPTNSSDAKKK